jgi:modification methylase
MDLNKIYQGDSRDLDNIDDECVHLTMTSPPYYVGKKYEKYLPTLEDYIQMLKDVFLEVVRVTIPGGKIIINLGDIAVGSQYNGGIVEELLIMPKIADFLRGLDTYLHGRIIWEKDDPWQNSSHVTFHDKVQHAEYRILPAWEYVFVFRKGKHARKDKSAKDGRWIDKHKEWKKWVHGVWNIRSLHRNDFHEAMFPEDLVRRCVLMYSFPNDVIFDPFMGSGSVAAAAKKFGRYYLGYELDPHYIRLANNRLMGITENFLELSEKYEDKTENRNNYQQELKF